MKTALTNAIIYTGERIETGKAILVKDGLVEDLVTSQDVPSSYEIHDLEGMNISPAFIDLQIYGGNGKLFSHELNVESLQSTYAYCLSGGAAYFMITMATSSMTDMLKGMEAVRNYWAQGGKGLLGLHLEGPYINPVKKGAHIEEDIKKPTLEELRILMEAGRGAVQMITIAPELCEVAVISFLLNEKIIVSAGHSNATYKQATLGFDSGITATTHLFNAMSPLQGREPGLVGAVYDHEQAAASIICDGVHVDFASVRVSKKIMKERLFFITDAVTAVSEGGYKHVFKDNRYTLENGTLSGSSLTMMKSIMNAVEFVGITLEEALRMASTYPGKLFKGPAPIGKIEPGYTADFVVFDNKLDILRMIIY